MIWLAGTWPSTPTRPNSNAAKLGNGSRIQYCPSSLVSVALAESRLIHRLMRYGLYYLRNVDQRLLHPLQRRDMRVASDDYGVVPLPINDSELYVILYCSHAMDVNDINKPALIAIPISSRTNVQDKFHVSVMNLPTLRLRMLYRNNELLLDQGMHVTANHTVASVFACSGYTGRPESSFQDADIFYRYLSEEQLRETLRLCGSTVDTGEEEDESTVALMINGFKAELEDRKQPGYVHLVPTMRAAIGEADWPQNGDSLFIATPRRGLESEVTELLLLEALVTEAAAGDVQAQLLLQSIEAECGVISAPTPIAEIIAAQCKRVDALSRDQREQLRIHEEAVERHNQRPLISSASPASSTSVVVERSADPLTFTSSSAAAAAAPQAPAYSWTQSKSMQSLESLLTAGRQKYATIVKVGLKVLYSLKPSSVNRSGGRHLVFHYPVGSLVTLVLPHTGGGSNDSTVSAQYCTRLYQRINEAVMRQLNPNGSEEDGATGSSARMIAPCM